MIQPPEKRPSNVIFKAIAGIAVLFLLYLLGGLILEARQNWREGTELPVEDVL